MNFQARVCSSLVVMGRDTREKDNLIEKQVMLMQDRANQWRLKSCRERERREEKGEGEER